MNTRSRSNKTKPAASGQAASNKTNSAAPKKANSPAPKKAKPGPKPKKVRFASETKTNTSKRETKNAERQSRSTHRITQHGRGNHSSPSPQRTFDRPNFGFPYGAQSPGIGHGFDWRYPIPPFGYYNYPNFNNPIGFGPQRPNIDWFASTPPTDYYSRSAKGKRRREPSSDSSTASTDGVLNDDDVGLPVVTPPVVERPAKRIARSKSCKWYRNVHCRSLFVLSICILDCLFFLI